MTSYKEDSTAEAVILSDIGEFDGRKFSFSRHIRIKILKKAGLDWGNWTFKTPAKGDFKVFVFNVVAGEIVKDKADHNSIYNEQVIKGFDVYKVFAPNVKVGSVIDIFYSFQRIPYEWRFQERIPIAYNKLTLWNSNFVSFTKAHFGFEPIETVSANEWRATHMPAFKTEPDMNNYSNYITKFEFYPESINGGWFVFDVNTSWKNVVNSLLEIPRFGGILNEAMFLNEFANETKKKALSTPQKIDEAFRFIQKNIKWNGQKRLFGTFDLRNNFLVNHSGSSAEINLSLIALLNKMDITTYPVVLSTRENGMVLQHVPMLGN